MLALGVLVMFAAFATIMIGVIILGDYKATEVVDRETLDERDVSMQQKELLHVMAI